MTVFRYTTVALLLLAAGGSAVEASDLFEDDFVLDVTLEGPYRSLLAATENRDEFPFTLDTAAYSHEIDVRIRGNSRVSVCEFPPLRLNFPDDVDEASVFHGQDKLKLVTHCRNYDRGEQDLLEEYVAYRIFNLLSEASYRVRLLRINYRGTEGWLDVGAASRYAFLIEPTEMLVERIGASIAELDGMPVRRHDRELAALVYVFQYMIGNTDWGLVSPDDDDVCCHNVDLFERDGVVLTVPFDFDLAGLVNARYAFPDPSLRIRRVTQRRYRGICTDRAILQQALQSVRSKRAEILEVPESVPGLSGKSAATAQRYLQAFFERAEAPDKLLATFESRCIG